MEIQTVLPDTDYESKLVDHRNWVGELIENTISFGSISIYAFPSDLSEPLHIPDVRNLFRGTQRFSEAFYHADLDTTLQNAITKGLFARGIKEEIKSSCRWTIYTDGFCAFDSQLDHLFNENQALNPVWLSYEIQRTLQLFYSVLNGHATQISLLIEFGNLIGWIIEEDDYRHKRHPFTGRSLPIKKIITLDTIYHDRENWSNVMPIVKEIIDEVATMFGLADMIIPYFDRNNVFLYYNFYPSTR